MRLTLLLLWGFLSMTTFGMAESGPGAGSAKWVLLPQPRTAVYSGASLKVQEGVASFEGLSVEGRSRLRGQLKDIFPGVSSTAILFRIESGAPDHPQGYILDIDPMGIRLASPDEAGLYHGLMTIRQLARQTGGASLPHVHIEDWPDFPVRGAMLDISRDKLPEMATLYNLLEQLAEWKINQVQLYTEHTYAYRNHPKVWQDASPMTPSQLQALDAWCKERFIELVPNQNSFGHMARWLQHDEYRSLAEKPEGGDLCAIDPACEKLLADLYADLLPNFTSRFFNVGCDETWTLGKGRSKQAAEERGVGRVYLDFLLKIHGLVSSHGRTMMFWGDIIMEHPELIPDLPKDLIALEWGYEADHPFADHGAKFAASQIPFYVCPGTSSWNTLAGRTANALENLRNAAENGRANGATGYLITDWGDGGHWQFLPVSFLGFAYGAAVSWSLEANRELDLPGALDVHVFQDQAGIMGKLVSDLGNAYQKTGVLIPNSTVFYSLLQHDPEEPLADTPLANLTREALEETLACIDQTLLPLDKATMARSDAGLISREYQMTGALMRFACRLGLARLQSGGAGTSGISPEKRATLAAELAPLIPEFRQIWLARNRSGGLKDSAGRFEDLLAVLKG